MKKKLATMLLMSVFFVGIIITNNACKKEEAKGTDRELYDMAKATNGFTWYKNSDAMLDKSSGSGHNYPFLRTRYNVLAASQLDADGKVKSGASFPDGSLIVKELHNSSHKNERYAILYKQSGHADADAKGWVWGYINDDGTVAEAAANKGKACNGCHNQADNIDYMLMNKYFP